MASNTGARAVAAHKYNRMVRERLKQIRMGKIEVYLLLSHFKQHKLYRYLDLPVCPRHAAEICAERRFPTWQDYLASLGDCGISFGYFAELERLEERFGTEFVRLCGIGIPVEVRRYLLKTRWPERIDDTVKGVLAEGASDEAKIGTITSRVAIWRSEEEAIDTGWQTPHTRVSRYRRHARRWQEKLAVIVDQITRVPSDFRQGPAFYKIVWAWREVFASHVATGERLARLWLSPELSLGHMAFLRQVREDWEQNRFPSWARSEPGAEPAAGQRDCA